MLKFDSYTVIRKIDEGGMANVYLVEDEKGRQMALKELKKELQNQPEKLTRFKNESFLIKDFECRNIIKIFEPSARVKVIKDDSQVGYTWVYAMEYLDKSLKGLIAEKKLTMPQIRDIFTGILNALDYCHSRKVIHRDIKPANILLRSRGDDYEVVLTDFGIAKMYRPKDIKEDEQLTVEMMIMGAPAYMSPEQISDSRKVDARSDLYSLGIVLYEAISGKKPYSGDKWDIIAQHKNTKTEPPSIRGLRSDIDPKLEALVNRLMKKDPKQRPQSAKEALHLLDDATTTMIDKAPAIDLSSYIYKKNTYLTVSLYNGGRLIKNTRFNSLPVIIGRLDRSAEHEPGKFEIPETVKAVSRDHCIIEENGKREIVVRDLSKYGTTVNNISLRSNNCNLKSGLNEIILANTVKLQVHLGETKTVNPLVYGAAAAFVVILIILTLTLSFA